MLKGISPLISPDLLATLSRMGHGEEIVFADAHYPVHQAAQPMQQILRADGLQITDLLDAILPLFELDSYDDPAIMMAAVPGDSLDPSVSTSYQTIIDQHSSHSPKITSLERFAFYTRAEKAHAIIATSATEKYANIILKKGVTPLS